MPDLDLIRQLRAVCDKAPFELTRVVQPPMTGAMPPSFKRAYDVQLSKWDGTPVSTTLDLNALWHSLGALPDTRYASITIGEERHPRGTAYYYIADDVGIILLREFQEGSSGAWWLVRRCYLVGTISEMLERLETLGSAKSVIKTIAPLLTQHQHQHPR